MAKKVVKVSGVSSSYSKLTNTLKVSWTGINTTTYTKLKQYSVEYYFKYTDNTTSAVKTTDNGKKTSVEISTNANVNIVYYRVKPIPDDGATWTGEWSSSNTKSKWTNRDIYEYLTPSELKSKKKVSLTVKSVAGTFTTANRNLRITFNAVDTSKYKHLSDYEIEYTYSDVYSKQIKANTTKVKTGKRTIYDITVASDADYFYFRVRPVQEDNTQWKSGDTIWTSSWSHTGSASSWKKVDVSGALQPTKPSNPTVALSSTYKMTASVPSYTNSASGLTAYALQFNVYDETSKKTLISAANGKALITAGKASISFDVTAGHKYKARVRAVACLTTLYNASKKLNQKQELYSDWTDYSGSDVVVTPATVKGIKLTAKSGTVVYVDYSKATGATSYTVQYSDNADYIKAGNAQSATSTTTRCIVEGLESGKKWYFRVRSENGSTKTSAWSDIYSVMIGERPAAPTTWSYSTTTKTNSWVKFYWTHNANDNSAQTLAQIAIFVDGVAKETVTVTGTKSELDYYANINRDATLTWKVRTKGAIDSWSDWSTTRSIKIYTPPTLTVSGIPTTVTNYPITLKTSVSPSTQTPIGFYVEIASRSNYSITNVDGTEERVYSGDVIFAKNYDINKNLNLSLKPSDFILHNSCNYTIRITAVTNSGLSAIYSKNFTVSFATSTNTTDLDISFNADEYTVYLHPSCIDSRKALVRNVLLSIYRIAHDGSLIEIASGLNNSKATTVVDYHPTLNGSKYRVTAQDKTTGIVTWSDVLMTDMFDPAVIIQWDQPNYHFYDEDREDEMTANNSHLLKLPWNVEMDESNDRDTALVEYAGRRSPVSYYGTQLGEKMTIKAEIRKTDNETMFQLRRLANYRGDAYVREPSGVGYWAKIDVSISNSYDNLLVPVTLSVTRVEGGA